MKPRTTLLVALTLGILSATATAQSPVAEHPASAVQENVTGKVRQEVLQAVENWKRAVIDKDRAGLEAAYHDELSYGHTDGAVLGKAEQIGRNLAGGRRFTDVEITDLAIRVYGKAALVTAKFAFHIQKDDGEKSTSRLAGIDVWTKGSRGWQLVGRQLTRLPQPAAAVDPRLIEQAKEIHKSIVTFDNHADIPFEFGNGELDAANDGKSQVDLPKLNRGIVKGAALAVFVPQGPRTAEGFQKAKSQAEQKYAAITGIAEKYPDRAAIALTPAEFRSIEASGKVAIVLSILNGYPLGKDLSQLDWWYAKGVRLFGFTHQGNNDLADSSRPNLLRGDKLDEHGGLSPLGKKAVAKLNDLGILIDVSQITGNALSQVLELSRAPVIASHSNARAIVDHPRNLTDDQLRAIAAKGGVVAINAYGSWVRRLPEEAQRKVNEVRRKYGVPEEPNIAGVQPLTTAGVKVLTPEAYAAYSKEAHDITGDPAYKGTLAQYVDQLDYVVKTIGIDHVGISSDFNHGGGVVGWENEGESVNVTVELLRRGYTKEQIAKLWGENFLRVWGQAQALSRK